MHTGQSVTRTLVCAAICGLGLVSRPVLAELPQGELGRQLSSISSHEVEPAAADADAWWQVFNDPVLDGYCRKAISANADLAMAMARLKYARAFLAETKASQAPQLAVLANASRQDGPLINAAGGQGDLYDVSLSLSLPVDLFQRLADHRRLAKGDVQIANYLWQAMRRQITRSVAEHYLRLQAIDLDDCILQNMLVSAEQAQAISKVRYDSGEISALEYEQARLEGLAIKDEQVQTSRLRARLENSLAVLLGQTPGTFHVTERTALLALPPMPDKVSIQTVALRPEIAAESLQVDNARLRRGLSGREALPDITLGGTLGSAAMRLEKLLTPATAAWTLAAALAQPIVDGGRTKARKSMADAELEAAEAAYRKGLLNGARETEDALSDLSHDRVELALGAELLKASEHAYALAESQYQAGHISQLDRLSLLHKFQIAKRSQQKLQAQYAEAGIVLIVAGAVSAPGRETAHAE